MKYSTRRSDLRFYTKRLTGYLTYTVRLAPAKLLQAAKATTVTGKVARLLAIGLSLCLIALAANSRSFTSSTPLDKKPVLQPIDYQIYALQQLRDIGEWRCLLTLYSKESAWNVLAINGNHYGIPQGRSDWLRTQSGYVQVDWGIKYNKARYHSMCGALKHWKRYGWH